MAAATKERPQRFIIVAEHAESAVELENEVRIEMYEAISGLSRKSMENMIFRGQWIEGRQYHRDALGSIWIDRKGVRAWIRGGRV